MEKKIAISGHGVGWSTALVLALSDHFDVGTTDSLTSGSKKSERKIEVDKTTPERKAKLNTLTKKQKQKKKKRGY